MASRTRDTRVITTVPCPRCGAHKGQACRNPVPHQTRIWCAKHQRWHDCPEDRRAQPVRPHSERRALWVMYKHDDWHDKTTHS
jgi:hypothetical protein